MEKITITVKRTELYEIDADSEEAIEEAIISIESNNGGVLGIVSTVGYKAKRVGRPTVERVETQEDVCEEQQHGTNIV